MKRGHICRIVGVVVLLSVWLMSLPVGVVLAAPMLTLSPDSGAVGTEVTITGENFDSYKGDQLSIFFDEDEIAVSPITVPQTGTFSFSFNVPVDAEPGSYSIRARSELGSTLALTSFTVLRPRISLDEVSGTVGTTLTVEGRGFHADRVVTLYFGSRMLGTETASSIGEFVFDVSVPESPAGDHVILAKNAEGNSASEDFEIVPNIVLDRTSGAAGDILKVSGNGFAAKSDVAVYFKFEEVAYARTNELGNLDVAFFNIPAVPPGSYEVAVEDEEENRAMDQFSVVAGVRIDQTEANVGSDLTVSGTGFEAGNTVTVAYDETTVGTVTTDSDGAFQFLFRVPEGQHGEHIITVDDGVNTEQLVFILESEAPPVPALLAPAAGSQVKAQASFDWRDVDDPSQPVAYLLQVASDKDFATVVLQKELTESEYDLTEEETLKAVTEDSPYYWRVRAIDSAANESEWSEPIPFSVPAPPAPRLLLPQDGSEAEAEAYFDWEDVTSLSPPLTYHLQVASDSNFTELVLEKEGLAESEYQVSGAERLEAMKKEFPYYWRVRAIDGADNQGEWSEPGTFRVGFAFSLPSWAIYVLIAIGAAIIAFLTFWLGRRTAYQA